MKSPAERPSGSSPRTLPVGWRWVRLGEVVRDAQAGFACGLRDPEGIAQLRMNNLGTRGNFVWDDVLRVPREGNNIEQFLLVPGDVLFNNTNSTELVGKSALFDGYDEPIVYSNHFTRLRPANDSLSPAFLSSWLNHQWQQGVFAAICNRWIGQSAVKADKLLNLDFPLPPFPEQQRIAAILRERMAAVEEARAAAQARLEAVKALPAAFLRQVFPRPGQRLPDGWRWVKLEEVCDGAGQYGTSIKSSSDQRGVPVLGMYHIHEGRIRWQNVSYVELKAEELPKYLLRKGDLLFNRTNSAALVGKTAVYDTDKAAVFASYLIRFPLVEEIADSHFLSAFINSREGRRFIEANMAQAIGQVNISASTMRTMPVPLPPLHEQQRIAGMLRDQMAAVDRARAAAEAELNTINALPAALLRRAFNGEI